jgi:hypothetical protein
MNASSSFAQPVRAACGATGPYWRELRNPVQGLTLIGGINRFAPAVLSAYGMPLKVLMPFLT